MNIEIINKILELEVYGFSSIAINKDYVGTAFQLMDKMWKTVKSNHLEHQGHNIWIYEDNEKVFAGVQLTNIPKSDIDLQQKKVTLTKYAYYKHIGPYNIIKPFGQAMIAKIKNKGFEVTNPYIEIYGHMTMDETKLETELFMSLK